MFEIQNQVLLAPYTSFNVGGPAEHFALVDNADDLLEALKCTLPSTPLWTLGYGSNCLISDKGLNGMTVVIKGGEIKVEDSVVIADAGAWWDDVVMSSIQHGLWGLELMSEIPGSVGASVFINITAYGQSVGKRVLWIDVWNRESSSVERLKQEDLQWGYKDSLFQHEDGKKYVILKAAFQLSDSKTEELTYQKALDVAEELDLDVESLVERRDIIIEARRRAGSLWHPGDTGSKTVGSFFRNPFVSAEQVDKIIAHDETGKTAEQIRNMNLVHGGDSHRVSAAHVMLAAGFKRGQTFADGKVKLNDQNLLKIEALESATANDIYETMKHIQAVVKETLGIDLEPEARILGEFI